MAQILKDINICFLFAQKYHPAMRFVGGVRKEIGIRTLFNILGPLANPAVFLASDASNAVNGHILYVDGDTFLQNYIIVNGWVISLEDVTLG